VRELEPWVGPATGQADGLRERGGQERDTSMTRASLAGTREGGERVIIWEQRSRKVINVPAL